MRVVFMGTPAFALSSLEALLAAGYAVVGVVTQPDRPVGRRPEPQPPPLKRLAVERGLPLAQAQRLREPAAQAQLAAWQPDIIVVVAFGQLLPPEVLRLPRFGCLNVHASLLPQLRGAAPVAASIAAGLSTTGVTIMLMDEGLDTGPILAQAAEPIRPDDTTPALGERLSRLGARLLVETIPAWAQGRITPRPQDASQASYSPRLRREDGEVHWRRPAAELHRLWRAYQPWPGLYTWWHADTGERQMLKLLAVRAVEGWRGDLPPGRVFVLPVAASAPAAAGGDQGEALAVATGAGALVLDRLQGAGGRPMEAAAFRRGHPALAGATLGR
ncbi:MAG: methionyl-tRNA formyltransferase [Chloroflexi bacterium]|nr:methionyl-tRNA formyltransferase [Chloroflexota bacterium]